MGSVQSDVSRLSLEPQAFFFADLASVMAHSSAYNTFQDWFVELLAGAAREFDEIGTALDKSADAYADADTRSDVNLQSIYGTRPE